MLLLEKKIFKGYIIKNNKKKIQEWIYHVRDLRPETFVDGIKMGKVAFKNGIIKRKKIGFSYIYSSNYKRYFNFMLKILRKNPWFSIVGPKY